ncbi:lycopene cyclase domain-containing protein [Agromyces sp. S2-1-8]|uniref:lycopene cyclase domain-containing protein n=1 Tax=Agromyces sp. S2-1-8 TaxID=2897180 RepID=UPI001E61A771|nr:lycopene cyclase domain-containing protein [Agromyces sp. S2-1-8]MCD5345262.1 lycopene cyclase domain-containing protein [Agromyces sp. S2-1-8]
MSFAYLGALAASIACLALVDVRFRLVFAAPGRSRRAAVVVAAGVAFFLAWDLAGIALGIFHRAENAVSTGVLLAPELPIEELVFLAFLAYLTLVLYTVALRFASTREDRRR